MNELQRIPIEKIVESKTNPRHIFDSEPLKELSASILKSGVQVPITVRPLGDKYEIVFGARRTRASKLAGLKDVPAYVREMDAEEAALLQLIEYFHHEGIDPMAEAEALVALQKKGKFDLATLSDRTGKPRWYVAERLQLPNLIPSIRKVIQNLTIGATLEAAKLPAETQKELFEWMEGKIYYDSTVLSKKEVKEFIERALMLNLSSAPFKPSDEKLLSKAGACTVCPKCTAAHQDLFGDLKESARCLDGTCYKLKVAAHIALKQKEADDEGTPLLKLSDSYSNTPAGTIERSGYQEASAKKANAVGIMVDGPRAGKIVHVEMTEHQAETAKARSTGEPSEAQRRSRYNRRMQIFSTKVEAGVRAGLAQQLLTKVNTVSEEDLRIIGRWIVREKLGYDARPHKEFLGMKSLAVDGLKSHQVIRLLLALAIADKERIIDPSFSRPSAPMLAILEKHYKLDRVAITKAVETELEPMKPKPFKPAEKPKKPVPEKKAEKQSGVCQVCGCTESTPCTLRSDGSKPFYCSWTDNTKTLCNKPACIKAAKVAEKSAPKKKTKKTKK